jgi:transposase
MTICVIGIDLGKQSFHVHGVDAAGAVVVQKKLSRAKLHQYMATLEPCLVGLEACAGSHYWARELAAYGHEVRLMSPQYVKPCVKTNKNDFLDAEGICEAVTRPSMRFVPAKTVDQQALQQLHRARSQTVAHRTAQANQLRGFLMEYGLVIAQGIGVLRRQLPELIADEGNGLSAPTRTLLSSLREELVHLDERVKDFDHQIAELARQDESCSRLQSIPGIGPMIATALVAAVGNGGVFRSGRDMAAWLGLVPRQHSTGGRPVLLGISKRGDRYLRTLLIHGARAVVRMAAGRDDRHSRWITALVLRRGTNVAAVALANKNARIAWVLLQRGGCFQPQVA